MEGQILIHKALPTTAGNPISYVNYCHEFLRNPLLQEVHETLNNGLDTQSLRFF